jgi:hypothetical protein
MDRAAQVNVEEAFDLISRIGPMLAGHPAQVQGAVLSDLMATWLAGHIADNPAATRMLREELLRSWVEVVGRLVPGNSEQIHGRKA